MKKTKMKTIDINAKEWFDKANGNSYFAGTVTVNYGMDSKREYKMHFQYGYGESYVDEGLRTLSAAGELPLNPSMLPSARLCREGGIIIRTVKHVNCKKSELKNI